MFGLCDFCMNKGDLWLKTTEKHWIKTFFLKEHPSISKISMYLMPSLISLKGTAWMYSIGTFCHFTWEKYN